MGSKVVAASHSPVVKLTNAVHFLGGDGEDIAAESGQYVVESVVGRKIRLSTGGRSSLIVDAITTTHTQDLATPLALTVIDDDEDLLHLVLLLPNGTALDAIGSQKGTRPLGSSLVPVSPVQIQGALLQKTAVVRDHRDAFYFDLAYFHAPIHYQFTHSARAIGDYITRFDFDGNWAGRDNWDNMQHLPLPAYVYYSVVETVTHWFIIYMSFHPQDWAKPSDLDQEHENDMEGELSIIRRDGSRFGKFEGMVTTFHHDFYSYTPVGSALRDGPLVVTQEVDANGNRVRVRQDIDGEVRMQSYEGSLRPLTNQEDRGHGLKAYPYALSVRPGIAAPAGSIPSLLPGRDLIVYYPSRTHSEVPSSGNDRNVKYSLMDIFAPNGLWEHQLADIRETNDPRPSGHTFISWGTVVGNESGSCGAGYLRWCVANADLAPWLWDDTGEVVGGIRFSEADAGVYAGEMALNPAHLTKFYFTGLEPFSETYTRNRYLSDLCQRGYHQGNLPKGWPSRLNLDQLYSKLNGGCQEHP
ncbi:MAG TPA: hypothetical protein PK614_06715 [Nitrospira sp.]|nr:hypothetical protein [Nitrospira sp.]